MASSMGETTDMELPIYIYLKQKPPDLNLIVENQRSESAKGSNKSVQSWKIGTMKRQVHWVW